MNTRRYHGLLTAATKPPVGRMVMLSKLEETLVDRWPPLRSVGQSISRRGASAGHRYLREFRLDPFPIVVFDVGGIEIEKRVFMVHGENTTVVEYECTVPARRPTASGIAASDRVSRLPLDHARRTGPRINSVSCPRAVQDCRPTTDCRRLYLAHNAAAVEITGDWYRNFEYWRERDRGLDFS